MYSPDSVRGPPPSASSGRPGTSVASERGRLSDLERVAWALVGVTLLGDVMFTLIGLSVGATEGNPIARQLMETIGTLPAMAILKLSALAVAVFGWSLLPPSARIVVPMGLAVPWGLATALNVAVVTVLVWPL